MNVVVVVFIIILYLRLIKDKKPEKKPGFLSLPLSVPICLVDRIIGVLERAYQH